MDKKIRREQETLKAIIEVYCKSEKHGEKAPCKECSELLEYSLKRLNSCKFGVKKPVCAKCKIHCYEPKMRQRIRDVMKSTGPKLILKHPILLINHIIDSMRG